MKFTRLIALGALIALLFVPASAGRRNSPRLAETVDLPATFDLDFSLASKMRSQIGAVRDVPQGGEPGQVGQEVFTDLTSRDMVSSLELPYRWTFSVLRSPIVERILFI